MSPYLSNRPPAREAGPELLVMQRWEEFTAWLLPHTGRWPRSVRFTFSQRVQNHALDVTELLVVARYDPRQRSRMLRRINLLLERLRHLFRLARGANVMPKTGFESAMRGLDEVGRMIGGWRKALDGRASGRSR